MKFGWDEEKRRSNIAKPGLDFVGVEEVFDGATATVLDDRFDYGEERFVTFGLWDGRVVAVTRIPKRTISFASSACEKQRAMKKKDISKKSETDWKRVDALSDKDIDLTETPEVSAEMFARATVRRGLKLAPRKTQLTLRVDSDVLDWYKRQGAGYQTKINALLRAYMEAHR